PEGTAIGWGTLYQNTQFNDNGPLEKLFSLDNLELRSFRSGDRDDLFQRAVGSRDGVTLAHKDRELQVKRGSGTAATWTAPGEGNTIFCYTLLPRQRAVVGTNFGLYLVDTESGKQLRQFFGHSGPVTAVAPSPDGKYFVSVSSDATVRVY